MRFQVLNIDFFSKIEGVKILIKTVKGHIDLLNKNLGLKILRKK